MQKSLTKPLWSFWSLVLIEVVVIALALLATVTRGQQYCPDGQCPTGQPCAQPAWQSPQYNLPSAQGWRPAKLAQPARREQPYPALVVIEFRVPGHSEQFVSTGVIVAANGETAIVLTAAHGYRTGMGVVVIIQGGQRYRAEITGLDAIQDVMLLKIVDPGIAPLLIAATEPVRGEFVYICGFEKGRLSNFSGEWGKVTEWFDPGGGRDTFIETTCFSQNGQSGGPIMNRRGQVCGILKGNRGNARSGACGPCLPRVRKVLKFLLPPYPRRPGAIASKPRRAPAKPKRPRAVVEQLERVVFPPKPQQQQTAQVDATTRITIDARLDRIEKLIAALAKQPSQPGPAGPQGPPGDDGKAGPIGPAGKDAPLQSIPLDDIVAEVIARLPELTDAQIASLARRLPPIYLRAQDPNTGKLSDEIQVRLGEGGIIVITKAVHPVPASGGK